MADYQFIAGNELDPGSPVNTALMTRLARNPEAIAEGDPDAPPISVGALGRPTAGEVRRFFNAATIETDSTVFVPVYTFIPGGAGSFRIKLENMGSSTDTAPVEVRVDGVTVFSWGNLSGQWTPHSGDVSFNAGELIEVVYRGITAGYSAQIRNLEFLTDGEELFPVVDNAGNWSLTP